MLKSVNPRVEVKSVNQDSFRFIVVAIKREPYASNSFQRFCDFSSCQLSLMLKNVEHVRPILLQIINDLLASVKFKFNSLNFSAIIAQMFKFDMDNYQYWTLIINQGKSLMNKYLLVNKAKYEDLVYFFRLTYNHINQTRIELNYPTFCILFSVIFNVPLPPRLFLSSSSSSSSTTSSSSSFSPPASSTSVLSSPIVASCVLNEIECIRSPSHDGSSIYPSNDLPFTLKPHNIIPQRPYRRPKDYFTLRELGEITYKIPLESSLLANTDPRIKLKISTKLRLRPGITTSAPTTPASTTTTKPRRVSQTNGPVNSPQSQIRQQVISPESPTNESIIPIKRKRIVWDGVNFTL